MNSRCFAYRRTIAIAAVWVAAMVALGVTSPSASGQEAFDPGTGNAKSQLVKVEPKLGGLSFGITTGLAIAGHQNTVAQADSRSIDLGVIGTTLAGEACDGGDPTLPKEEQPQPVVARSGEADSAGTKESDEIPGLHQEAFATEEPFAVAETTAAPFGLEGVIEVGPGVATTSSGVVEDGVREARAIVDYGQVELAGGAVVLRGLRWEAVHRTGAEELVDGDFTVEALSVAGAPVPVTDGAEAINQANQALRLLGFELLAPTVRKVEGVVFVDPLRFAIVPAKVRDDLTGSILGNENVQQLRENLSDRLIEMDCGNATYITVADIVLGSITAAGELGFEIGGAQATTSEIDAFQFPAAAPLTPVGDVPALDSPSTPSDLGTGTVSSPSPATTPSSAPAPTDDASSEIEEALPVVDSIAEERGGAMAAVAGAGLLMLAALAEADRRKMLRAQRMIPMEMA